MAYLIRWFTCFSSKRRRFSSLPYPVSATTAKPATPKYVEGQKELPNTGTGDNASLAALGLLGVLSGFGLVARKKKED